ncbi:MBL fold metallo-hydrolase [Parafrigoribacterium humi]|uniref:MBL fold metallo-hydrolase n=1 Tax=Parafrigoribacterium humi TaxID=3144664 RepID=UPI0032EEDD9F
MPTTAITLIGGPTVLLEWAGLRIVTDPTFDAPQSYEDPGSTPLVKTAGPAIPRERLGQVDLVLLSHHAHKDNLDYEGLELLATGVTTLSTRKASMDLFGGSVVGLDSWESYTVGDATVTAVPALHGPPGSERFVGPVIGFVLEAADAPTIYVSGDNASVPLVEQIADRFSPVDVAILHAGAARVPAIDAALTLTGTDAVAAAKALQAAKVAIVHAEDWKHLSEDRATVDQAFADADLAELLVQLPRGERVEL